MGHGEGAPRSDCSVHTCMRPRARTHTHTCVHTHTHARQCHASQCTCLPATCPAARSVLICTRHAACCLIMATPFNPHASSARPHQLPPRHLPSPHNIISRTMAVSQPPLLPARVNPEPCSPMRTDWPARLKTSEATSRLGCASWRRGRAQPRCWRWPG